jgi:hypothetical protein
MPAKNAMIQVIFSDRTPFCRVSKRMGSLQLLILLAKCFFMSETPILLLSDLQNSICFSSGMTSVQGF